MCHPRRNTMVRGQIRLSKRKIWIAMNFLVFAGLSYGVADAQEPRDEGQPAARAEVMPQQMTQPADGSRHGGLPIEAYAGVPGKRVLVRLEDELETGETKKGRRFSVRTLEPLAAGSGVFFPAGGQDPRALNPVGAGGINRPR